MNRASYDTDYLRKYIKGELSSQEMHAIERASHEDEMLMDIILGLEIEDYKNLSPINDNLLASIRERSTKRTPVHTIFNTRNLSIAASLIFLIGIGSFFYFNHEIKRNQDVVATVIHPNKPDLIAPVPADSFQTKIEEMKPDSTQDILIAQRPTKSLKKQNKNEPNTESNRLAYEVPMQESRVPLEGKEESLDNILEEVIIAQSKPIVGNTISFNQPQQVILPSRQINVNTNNQNHVQSSAQLHAKINNMNIDPQSKLALRAVIDRNERELLNSKNVDISENNQNIIDSNSTILASLKKTKQSTTGSILNKSDQSFSLSTAKITSSSQPLIPKSDYLKNIHTQLSKFTDEDYLIKLLFSLDSNGIPKNIKILDSSHSDLNKEVKKLIKNGPKWHIGADKDSINLEIKK